MAEERNHFDSSRAELFEALGHPTRVKILRALDAKQMGFAELKREVGIESSGHLQFHLGKLTGLVETTPEGSYALTDEGKEALRVVSTAGEKRLGRAGWMLARPNLGKAALALAIVLLVALASFTFVQEQQIASLNRSLSQEPGTVLINGTRYAVVEIPFSTLPIPSSVMLDGVTFNLTSYKTGTQYGVLVGSFSELNETTPQGQSVRVTIKFAPTIDIIFSDGHSEYYGSMAPPTLHNGIEYLIYSPSPSPWFSQHTNPRAGVSWNPSTETYTFYVSLGS